MKVIIIGAGIGGLTLALALEQRGIEAEIYEAAPVFKAVGAGLVLAINAMQIYRRLELVPELQERGRTLEGLQITSPQLKTYSNSSLVTSEKKFGVPGLTIHRAELHELLRTALKKTPIHLGKRLAKCTPEGSGYQLEWADGSKTTAEVLIGADGIHSQVRASLFPPIKERFAKQWCWRGVCDYDMDGLPPTTVYEAWGKGCRFGIVPLKGQQVYWFACTNMSEGEAKRLDQQGLKTVFKDFHPVIPNLIQHTSDQHFLLNPLSDLPNCKQWYQGACCLMGDAAHATTPNMGQGANQAIESAWVLAEQLATKESIQAAFAAYQDLRQAKAQKIIKTSWQIGQLAQVENPFLIGIRRTLLALTPAWVAQRQVEQIYTLNY
ncbi:MAG: FAD-dependent monooxygenase [Aureispira sp.]